MIARPSCFMLLMHWVRRAASRADWTAGNSRAINTAMIAMTTSNSIRVKPPARFDGRRLIDVSIGTGCGSIQGTDDVGCDNALFGRPNRPSVLELERIQLVRPGLD